MTSEIKFKVGDIVRPSKFDRSVPAYEVKAIYSDAFGDVLLREDGGFGYAAEYCTHVHAKRYKK